jgi:hypothetical protein
MLADSPVLTSAGAVDPLAVAWLAVRARRRILYQVRTFAGCWHQPGQARMLVDRAPIDDEVNRMRRLGRRTSWLGWAVAGVLLVAAGGAALAAQDVPITTQAPGVSADKADTARARAGVVGRGGWRHALGRRVLHGEVTFQTQEGVKTVVMARGEVTALSGDAITVKSSDGVQTSFGIDGDTRFGFRSEPAPSAELKVGEDAFVAGEKSGDRAMAKRIVSGDLARRGTP